MIDTKQTEHSDLKHTPLISPSKKEIDSVKKWWYHRQEVDNGLIISIQDGDGSIGSVLFKLRDRSSHDPGHNNLLHAKVFETFGVHNPNIAAAVYNDCINCAITAHQLIEMTPEEKKTFLEAQCAYILNLFQEMKPRDSFELLLISKIIILDYLSNREFISSVVAIQSDRRTERQSRGIKLARLLLEFKEKLHKHRRPDQQINVQHNHVYNEGQAIIGSHLHAGGG